MITNVTFTTTMLTHRAMSTKVDGVCQLSTTGRVLHVTPGGIVYTAAQRDRINRTIEAHDVSLVMPPKWTPPGGAAPAVAGRV